jgi:hypothetical protein
MPVVFRHGRFRFFFFSNEGDPREPAHIHVRRGSDSAKLWLIPKVRVAHSDGFNAQTLRDLVRIAEENKELIERTWNDYFR